jgi:CP family cyanate transporter-like MFS transporter
MAALFTGLGQGGTFSMALALIVLRSPNTQTAWHVSAMTQGVGYTMAALGPFAVGLLRYFTPNLTAIFVLISCIVLGALVAGWFGGQKRWVEP